MEKGYTLVKIHEVWHFPPEERQTGLFKDYVNTWLKLKQESAGWPSWCQTVGQKRDYILRYKEREGIRLDIASIAKNPGRKATAKLMNAEQLLGQIRRACQETHHRHRQGPRPFV